MPLTPFPGGGSSSGGSGGGGGGLKPFPTGGGGGGGKKKSAGPTPQKTITQTSSRLARAIKSTRNNPQQRQVALQAIGQAFQGYTPEEIVAKGRKAGLQPGDINAVVEAAGAHELSVGPSEWGPTATALDYLQRPAQAVKGYLTETKGNVGDVIKGLPGAYKGLTGKEQYTGAETLAATALQKTKPQAQQWAQNLPGLARFGINAGVDIATDPTTYLTLGGGDLAEQAARTAAKAAVGQAAEDAVLSPAAREVVTQIGQQGRSALSKEVQSQLPKAVLRKLDRAGGGVFIAGKRVPFTRKLNQAIRNIGPQNPEGVGAGLEHSLRPRGELRTAERGGVVGKGVPQDIANIQAQQRGAEFLSELKPHEAQAKAAGALATGEVRNAYSRSEIRQGLDTLQKNPGILDPVRESLDVNGGDAARAALPAQLRPVAEQLRGLSNADFDKLVAGGRLQPDQVLEGAGITSKKLVRVQKLAERARARAEQERVKTSALQQEAEHVNVPAVQRPSSGEFGPSHHIPEDVTLSRRLGKQVEKQQALDRRAAGLEKTLSGLQGKMPSFTPQEQYLYHYPAEGTRRATAQQTSFTGQGVLRSDQGFLKMRTQRVPASEMPERYGQNPIVAVGLHGKGTVRQLASDNASRELGRLTDTAGDPLVITSRHQVPAGTGASSGTTSLIEHVKSMPGWQDKFQEMEIPVQHVVEGGTQIGKEKVLVNKLVAPYMKKVLASQEDHFLKRNLMYLNALWARYATASTGFISRNVLQGNLYMGMVLGEARDPRVWAKSLGTMARLQRGITRVGDPYAFLKPDEIQIVKGAMENNAVESNFLSQIGEQAQKATSPNKFYSPSRVTQGLKRSKASPFSPGFLPVERISAANQWMEAWGRLSVYTNKLKQGFAPPEAAQIARHSMLDYKDLSPVNDVARVVNPFLTWTYKSVPLILGTIARDPRKVAIPLTLLRDVNAEGVKSEGVKIQPQWIQQAGGVTLPKGIRTQLPGPFGQTPQTFVPDTPLQTTNDALMPILELAQAIHGRPGGYQEVARDVLNQVGPGGAVGGTAKTLAEIASGTQFYSGQQFKAGHQVPTPAPLIPFFGKTMPWEVNDALQNLIPVTSRVNAILPQSAYDKEARMRRILSMVGGVGVYPLTKRSVTAEKYRRIAELNAAIESIRSSGGRVPHHSRTTKSGGTSTRSSTGFPSGK